MSYPKCLHPQSRAAWRAPYDYVVAAGVDGTSCIDAAVALGRTENITSHQLKNLGRHGLAYSRRSGGRGRRWFATVYKPQVEELSVVAYMFKKQAIAEKQRSVRSVEKAAKAALLCIRSTDPHECCEDVLSDPRRSRWLSAYRFVVSCGKPGACRAEVVRHLHCSPESAWTALRNLRSIGIVCVDQFAGINTKWRLAPSGNHLILAERARLAAVKQLAAQIPPVAAPKPADEEDEDEVLQIKRIYTRASDSRLTVKPGPASIWECGGFGLDIPVKPRSQSARRRVGVFDILGAA